MEQESVREYVTTLRKMAAECEFTDANEHLRDRLVCGINNVEMQQQMLTAEKLDFQKAVSIAMVVELTERHLSLLASALKTLAA